MRVKERRDEARTVNMRVKESGIRDKMEGG
jgi:hypothetical protein